MNDLRREPETSAPLLPASPVRPQSAVLRVFANNCQSSVVPQLRPGWGRTTTATLSSTTSRRRWRRKPGSAACPPRCWTDSVRPRERATAAPSPPTDCWPTAMPSSPSLPQSWWEITQQIHLNSQCPRVRPEGYLRPSDGLCAAPDLNASIRWLMQMDTFSFCRATFITDNIFLEKEEKNDVFAVILALE